MALEDVMSSEPYLIVTGEQVWFVHVVFTCRHVDFDLIEVANFDGGSVVYKVLVTGEYDQHSSFRIEPEIVSRELQLPTSDLKHRVKGCLFLIVAQEEDSDKVLVI